MIQKDKRLVTYQEGLLLTRKCRLAGASHWRMPTVRELREIAKHLTANSIFNDVPQQEKGVSGLTLPDENHFWANDLCWEYDEMPLNPEEYAYRVSIPGGWDCASLKEAYGRVWIVKGVARKAPLGKKLLSRWFKKTRFSDNGDGTVTDTFTSLVWAKDLGLLRAAED